MSVAAAERCNRCGTILRNNRSVCPCCGYEVARPAAPGAGEPGSGQEESPLAHGIRKVSARVGVKICPVCMSTVNEADLVENDGQKVCPACDKSLRKKALKKAAQAPPPAE